MKPIMLTAILAAAVVCASAASAEEWNAFSSSTSTAYLADISSISVLGDDTTIRIARVPRDGPAGDYSHRVEEVVLRCAAKQSRTVLELEFGPDGAESARYDDSATPWDDVPANGLTSYIKGIACDGQRAQGANAASIQAFIDRGRGK